MSHHLFIGWCRPELDIRIDMQGRTPIHQPYKFGSYRCQPDLASALLDDCLQWESSIIILTVMPYVFLHEDVFVGVIGVLILSLLVLRYVLRRRPD